MLGKQKSQIRPTEHGATTVAKAVDKNTERDRYRLAGIGKDPG